MTVVPVLAIVWVALLTALATFLVIGGCFAAGALLLLLMGISR